MDEVLLNSLPIFINQQWQDKKSLEKTKPLMEVQFYLYYLSNLSHHSTISAGRVLYAHSFNPKEIKYQLGKLINTLFLM